MNARTPKFILICTIASRDLFVARPILTRETVVARLDLNMEWATGFDLELTVANVRFQSGQNARRTRARA